MFIDEIKHIKSSDRDLRKFGFLVGGVFAAISLYFLWRGRDVWEWLFGVGAVLIFGGGAYPALLKPFQKAWMTLGIILGWIMTHLILALLFYCIVTPLGILARLFSKKIFDKRFRTRAASYWNYREAQEFNKENLEKQF